MTEGRSCPLHYRYRPEQLTATLEACDADVLYVIGGLYGNPFALDEIAAMAARERQAGVRVKLVFNGDFHWFNVDNDLFRAINTRVLAHDAITGNVEYELARPADGAGCGCAYPEFVDNEVVERSNRIIERLQTVAGNHPDLQERLADLPRYRCLIFGGLKVVILHGDPESLAGWGLSHEALDQDGAGQLAGWFRQADADVIVSTHTCLPVARHLNVEGRPRLFLNNGSAGMGNLVGDTRGLIARLALNGAPEGALAPTRVGSLHGSLMPVDFPLQAWLTLFDRLWPAGSDAELSYRHRILNGTSLSLEQLLPLNGIDERLI